MAERRGLASLRQEPAPGSTRLFGAGDASERWCSGIAKAPRKQVFPRVARRMRSWTRYKQEDAWWTRCTWAFGARRIEVSVTQCRVPVSVLWRRGVGSIRCEQIRRFIPGARVLHSPGRIRRGLLCCVLPATHPWPLRQPSPPVCQPLCVSSKIARRVFSGSVDQAWITTLRSESFSASENKPETSSCEFSRF